MNTEHGQATVAGVSYDIVSMTTVVSLCRRWLESDSQHHVVTLNPEMVVEAQSNPTFARAVKAADLRIPDGSGLLWANHYLATQENSPWLSLWRYAWQTKERPVPGVDLIGELAQLCAERQLLMYLVGASPESNRRAQAVLKQRFPDLPVDGRSGGTVDMSGPAALLAAIAEARPAVVLVAYGAPGQTVWIDRHLPNMPSVRIAMGVGGALDMWAGATPRAPRWLRKHHLEWVWRWGLEPKRWRRMRRAVWSFPRLVRREKQRR